MSHPEAGPGLRHWLLSGCAALVLHGVVVVPFLVRAEQVPPEPIPPAVELDLMPLAAPVAPIMPPSAAPEVPAETAEPPPPELQQVAEIPPEPVETQPQEVVEPVQEEVVEQIEPDEPLIPDDLPVIAAAPVEVAVAKPVRPPRERPRRPRVVEAPKPTPPQPPPPQPVTRTVAVAPPVQQQTARPAPPAPAAPAVAMVPPPPPNVMPNFQGMLVAHLMRHQRYPRQAQRRREQGTAHVRIVMTVEGAVVSSALVRSSGFEDLDAEVMDLIRRAEPLPQIPPELNKSRLEVVVPVRFSLR